MRSSAFGSDLRGAPRWRRLVVLVGLVGLVGVTSTTAKFAASNGEFSGQRGDTCLLCHAPASTTPRATVTIEGLPGRWDAGESYDLTIRVGGGPPAMPSPRSQGGFELSTTAGILAAGPGMEGNLRFPQPQVITYTPEGTRMRAWQVEWTAPDLAHNPSPVTFWLAAIAANGNHVASGDQGATGDAVATLTRTVRASEATLERWSALPLLPPRVDATTQAADGWVVRGHHADDNATHLGYRLPGGPWRSVATDPTWTLLTKHDPAVLELRSEGMGRVSPVAGDAPRKDAPGPPLGGMLGVVGAAALRPFLRTKVLP